jgi:hypothetical protein
VLGGALIGFAVATQADAETGAAPVPRVVIIATGDEAFFRPFGERLLKGMRQLGHAEGWTFPLEVRYVGGEPARSIPLIREAIASRVDVLVVGGPTNARRAREATKTIPVVVATSSELVDAGIVVSFAHPGGNITGHTVDMLSRVAAMPALRPSRPAAGPFVRLRSSGRRRVSHWTSAMSGVLLPRLPLHGDWHETLA